MDQKAIYKFCKTLGCCEACCLRFLGLKNPNAYEDPKSFVQKYHDKVEPDSIETKIICESTSNCEGNAVTNNTSTDTSDEAKDKSVDVTDSVNIPISNVNSDACSDACTDSGTAPPPHKKRKVNICVSCLGILQEDNWQHSFEIVKDLLDIKGYECTTFACALSAPIATMLREKIVTLHIVDEFPQYDPNVLTPLKEAWKWSYGVKLAKFIDKTLDSGAISPLLVTVNMDYIDELQELEILKTVSPQLFEERRKQKRRFVTEFTRRSVEQALEEASLWSLQGAGARLEDVGARATCVGVGAAHAPLYLAGRYIKLSRNLPQSPWVLEGRRVLPSSVQEIIFAPLAALYKWGAAEAEPRLKLISAGREDVDVRCLGDGRPFAIEITDPTRQLTDEELRRACDDISRSGLVVVKQIVPIAREDLVQLKKGEETKSKTYEALCIKLTHSKYDADATGPVRVTPEDIDRINTYTNTETDVRISITQKTPIRVLHRRPLLTRTREILELTAEPVSEHLQLFLVRIRTSAGTYVKEWAHGELGRSSPALRDILGARTDLLALDVTAVHLAWPPHLPPHPSTPGDEDLS